MITHVCWYCYRCKTMDASADGYVRAEACAALALYPASSATTGAVFILGSAIGQDGRSSSLTAPNGSAQQRVIAAALQSANTDQASVSGTRSRCYLYSVQNSKMGVVAHSSPILSRSERSHTHVPSYSTVRDINSKFT